LRAGKILNNGDYMIQSTMVAILGRMAIYTGQKITWERALSSKEDLTPARYAILKNPEHDEQSGSKVSLPCVQSPALTRGQAHKLRQPGAAP
jgi:hypothetical protein